MEDQKPRNREVILIVDRSGSMRSVARDAEGGIAEFLDEQKKITDRHTFVTFVQFDDRYEVVYTSVPLDEVPTYRLNPQGVTALLGAVGKTVREARDRHKELPEEERPEVDVVIATDGYENASHINEWSQRWTRDKVFKLLSKAQEKWGWHITYIGATADAIQVAGEMGIPQAMSLQYDPSAVGTRSSWGAAGRMVTNSAMSGTYDGYTEAQRAQAMGQEETGE